MVNVIDRSVVAAVASKPYAEVHFLFGDWNDQRVRTVGEWCARFKAA